MNAENPTPGARERLAKIIAAAAELAELKEAARANRPSAKGTLREAWIAYRAKMPALSLSESLIAAAMAALERERIFCELQTKGLREALAATTCCAPNCVDKCARCVTSYAAINGHPAAAEFRALEVLRSLVAGFEHVRACRNCGDGDAAECTSGGALAVEAYEKAMAAVAP